MDFGVALPQTGIHASPEAIVQAAQTAERLGYRTVWVLERLLRPLHPRGAGRPPAAEARGVHRRARAPRDAVVRGRADRAHLGRNEHPGGAALRAGAVGEAAGD